MSKLLIIAIAIVISGCSTVTITAKGTSKYSTEPTHVERLSFFLFGLVGEREVDVKAICNGASPKQVQTKEVFMDGFLGVITLGIYSPRTVNVWCDGGKS